MIDQINILDCVDVINNSVLPYEGMRGYLDTGGLKSNKIVEIRDFDFNDKPSRANQNVEIGDIILARMKATTKVKVISQSESELMVSTGFIVLRPKRKIIDNNFLKHTLISQFFQRKKDKLCSGSTQKAINNGNFKKLKIPLPPLDQQKNIATILDAADAYRQKTKALIEKYEELTQSLFIDMFGDPVANPMGWEKVPFGNFITVLTDYHSNGSYESLRKVVTLKSEPDYALMVRTTDLENNNFTNGVNYIDEVAYNHLDKSKVFGGEIIINKIGSAGKVYRMPKLNRPVSLGMNAFLLRFNELIDDMFLYFQLVSPHGEREIKKRVKGAVTKTIRKDAVREVPLISPPLELQNQFAERVQAIEAQKAQTQASLAQAEGLFNSLLQRAFKGSWYD